jgi:hypothetical protein
MRVLSRIVLRPCIEYGRSSTSSYTSGARGLRVQGYNNSESMSWSPTRSLKGKGCGVIVNVLDEMMRLVDFKRR